MAITDYSRGNSLLSGLPAPDFAILQQHLSPISLAPGQILRRAGRPLEHAYFIMRGVAALRLESAPNISGEVALIGNEGVVGHDVALGLNDHSMTVEMLSKGEGAHIDLSVLGDAVSKSAALRLSLMEYSIALLRQVAETSLSNAKGRLECRLARRLLMVQDRLNDTILPFTHEALAESLGVRRAGVTTALRSFNAAGLIAAGRGSIEIRDRAGLSALTGGFYVGALAAKNGALTRSVGGRKSLPERAQVEHCL